MHLTNIRIDNFRGFKQLTLDLDRTTVLIGENNTGKTSVLDALRLCLSRQLSRRLNPFEDHDYHLENEKSRPGDAGPLAITLELSESKPNEWSVDVVQALGDVVALRTTPAGDIRHITLKVTSTFDRTVGDFVTDWDFLDDAGQSIPRGKRPQVLATLQQFKPVFYLSALRDAAREFQARSTFWAPFLRNPAIPANVQQQLETELSALNTKILTADPRLQQVKTNLAKAQGVVALGQKDTVSIDALPTKVFEMLSRAQVNVAGTTGAALPLLRHGAGTQSLSVIFLFQAFLEADLGHIDKLSDPILELEEPEAHLHPSAIRALWGSLEAMKGQQIIASHSGDLLSAVPLSAIRRFRRAAGKIEARKLQPTTLSPEEDRKVHFHIKRTRGELLFARCWLLTEGETEYWILAEAAQSLAVDLDRVGVRLVEYAQVGVEPFLKVADDLGIEWHCVADGDAQGLKNRDSAKAHLNGRTEATHVTVLPNDNMEEFLCAAGYGQIYVSSVDQNKKANLKLKPTDPGYWKQVLECQSKRYKIPCALGVVSEMKKRGAKGVPTLLKEIIDKAVGLATQ